MTTAHEGRVWFNTAQAADYSGFCTRTVADALRSGQLRGRQINTRGRWRIHRSWLDDWLGIGGGETS